MKTAEKHLIEAGPRAVDDLAEVMRGGDLESIERASSALTQIALDHHPSQDGGSWQKLSDLAAGSTGRVASSAQRAAGEVRDYRSQQAKIELAAAGVSVGIDEFMVRAISNTRMVVQIDERWQGDVSALHWLRWLGGVENARVMGPALNGQVLKQVAQMQKLKALALVDGTLDQDDLLPLLNMPPIETLELRYVKLSEAQTTQVAKIPIRNSLTLKGTGVSLSSMKAMQEAAPGLTIDHSQGGFLGVKCIDGGNQCEISDIVADSAAEEAGLIRNDVIVKVNDATIQQFSDLQTEINLHIPGDEITVEYRRGDVLQTTKLKLRRLLNR